MLNNKQQSGFIAVLATLLILSAMVAVALSLSNFVISQHKLSFAMVKSAQAYLAAESGIEDAIFRIREGYVMPPLYTLEIGTAEVEITISDSIGGSRTIISKGALDAHTRSLEVVNSLTGDNIQFFFGAQVGDGGLTMSNNSEVRGNVFANGDIQGTGIIKGSVIISGNHKIKDVSVQKDILGSGGDAKAFLCEDANIAGDFYFPPGGSEDACSIAGATIPMGGAIDPEALPITDAQINDWKAQATAGGTYLGNYSLGIGETKILGPMKIQGNLTFANSGTLVLTGTLWVTGNIVVGNNTVIKLDNATYGARSGVLVFDGTAVLSNNSVVQGTGQAGSYLMLLTTSSANPALTVSNNTQTGIFYANNGYITMANNAQVREVTAYGLNLANNVIVEYEFGLSNLFFTSGPGSGWKIEDWREVE